jgi:hypothetical protein
MKSQIFRLVTVSLAVAVLFLGLARMQGQRRSADSAGLRQIVTDLQHQVANLNATVHQQATTIHSLQSRIDAQDNTIAGLNNIVAGQSEKLKFVTVDGTEMYITGANVNIRNGSGTTSGSTAPYSSIPNGLGNLIIGYNENGIPRCGIGCPPQPQRPRTGSHNLVLGTDNGYTAFGGIVVGFANSITSPYATITGGAYSTASGIASTVSGGEMNMATVEGAAVSGGLGGIAGGRWASVTGGSANTASAESASVCGGSANTASGLFSTVTGGTGNKVTAQSSSISGGGDVEVDTQFTWAGGSLVSP